MQIIDTHQHLWDLDKFRYSWTDNQPALRRSFRLEEYLEAVDGIEVVGTIHVEADVDEDFMADETEYVLSLAEDPETIVAGVVAAVRPEYDDFRERLDRFAGRPGLKGVRRILHTMPDGLALTTSFVENVRSLAGYGLTFDICMLARQLDQAERLIREVPEVEFVLDHCGNPDLRSGEIDQWREKIEEIASLPNASCKVSGIVVNTSGSDWTVDDLRPAVEHVIACFGWDRVMFGSDWPVCTLASSYRRWFDALNEIITRADPVDSQKLFHDNAVRIYRL